MARQYNTQGFNECGRNEPFIPPVEVPIEKQEAWDMTQNDGPLRWSVQPELLTNISGSKGRNCGDRPGVGKSAWHRRHLLGGPGNNGPFDFGQEQGNCRRRPAPV